MALPASNEMYGALLHALQDGKAHDLNYIRNAVAQELNLSEAQRNEMLPSDTKKRFNQRISWTEHYLKHAGLISRVGHGVYMLTKEGRQILPKANMIDDKFLERYPSFCKFRGSDTTQNMTSAMSKEIVTESTPEEILEAAHARANKILANNLMKKVMNLPWPAFEHLAVQLLLKMGYGKGLENQAYSTQQTRDGGVDGVIYEDTLSFRQIYIQAKRQRASVSVEKLREFVGVLHQKAMNGLFITTSTFSKDAQKFIEGLPPSPKIVLIDGDQLMRLMIKYHVGVFITHTYEVQKIDTSFFEEEI